MSNTRTAKAEGLLLAARSALLCVLLLSGPAAAEEGSDLLTFKADLANAEILSSWTSGSDPCGSPGWKGVVCNSDGKVIELNLENLGLQGPLGESLGSLSGLVTLNLGGNGLVGPVPNSFGQLGNIKTFKLDRNQLLGLLPSELGYLYGVTYFDVSYNQLTGPIPAAIGQLTNLNYFNLAFNQFQGPLPDPLGLLVHCKDMYLHNNNFLGKLPDSLGNLTKLTTLTLHQNGFDNNLPLTLQLLTSLTTLSASYNKLTGNLQGSSLGKLPSLQTLVLNNNQYFGEIPASLADAGRLQTLNLSSNYLSGPVPPAIAKVPNLDVSKNADLCGAPSIAACPGQPAITAAPPPPTRAVAAAPPTQGPTLPSGSPPPVPPPTTLSFPIVALAPAPAELVTSAPPLTPPPLAPSPLAPFVRNFTNAAPQSLISTPPATVASSGTDTPSNVGTTNGSAVPAPLLQTQVPQDGNGAGVEAGGSNPSPSVDSATPNLSIAPSPEANLQDGGGGGGGSGAVVGIVVGVVGGLAVAVAMAVALVAFFRWARKSARLEHSSPILKGGAGPALLPVKAPLWQLPGSRSSGSGSLDLPNSRWEWFSYKSLSRATNHFSNENLLGEGGFGKVFKATLKDGTVVAVKQLSEGKSQGEREFRSEVGIISSVRHRNVVQLRGCCVAGAHRILVYDYHPNGSLDSHLYGPRSWGATMDWATRLQIAIDSARGLAYLHEDCVPKIIHRDVKSSNILLDESWVAKVADFGLARLSGVETTHVTTRVIGSFGYISPEYASSGQLTAAADVYAFGVVLLELITGSKPVDTTRAAAAVHLVDWAKQVVAAGPVEALADSTLKGQYPAEELQHMAEVAFLCVRRSAGQRPRMSQVVSMLEKRGKLEEAEASMKGGVDEEIFPHDVYVDEGDDFPSQTQVFRELLSHEHAEREPDRDTGRSL